MDASVRRDQAELLLLRLQRGDLVPHVLEAVEDLLHLDAVREEGRERALQRADVHAEKLGDLDVRLVKVRGQLEYFLGCPSADGWYRSSTGGSDLEYLIQGFAYVQFCQGFRLVLDGLVQLRELRGHVTDATVQLGDEILMHS